MIASTMHLRRPTSHQVVIHGSSLRSALSNLESPVRYEPSHTCLQPTSVGKH
ncbi:hypothetical protein OIU77_009167 [Salix suchowensis]|uniref:Uncharacterized protein n=1 Tax=Salix suchowensis TaxID=1278906 RepID=A0ABQ9AE08_9ROSI|nr:hypothetical protein OIU77_009167 [Salix suchowensis]